MLSPKEFIESIKDEQLNSSDFLLESHAGSLKSLQKAFPKHGSFLMEFVQNADDAKSTILKIEIFEDKISILNNGQPFNQDDVLSICKVGCSLKTPEDFVGYLGVGFKSVFIISDSPEINSGGFNFKFDKNAWTDIKKIPWQVIPLWAGESQIEHAESTIFNLPVKDAELEIVKKEINSDNLNDRILLFLGHIESIEIIDHTQNTTRLIEKSLKHSKTDYDIFEIAESINGATKCRNSWLVFRSTTVVPDDVKNDAMTIDWERDNLHTREVLVALKLNENNDLVVEEKGTAHIGVFSFLPLKEVSSGLNFLIQADFLTTTGRSDLARDNKWNNWLAASVYKLIIDKCIPVLLKNEQWKFNFTQILYSPVIGGHELFTNFIKKPLNEYLEHNNVLVALDGTIVKPSKLFVVDEKYVQIISENDLNTLYPGKKLLHPKCSFPYGLENIIEKGLSFTPSSGPSTKMSELLSIKCDAHDIDFFNNFYKIDVMNYSSFSSATHSRLKNQCIMLTDDFKLVDARSIYTNPENIEITQDIKDNFNVIHPDLDDDAKPSFVMPKLTKSDIENTINQKEIPVIRDAWDNYTDDDKIKNGCACLKLLINNKVTAKSLAFLSLKSKDGIWLKPGDLTLSSEYPSSHNIEDIFNRGLLNQDDLRRLNVNFISAEYIKCLEDEPEGLIQIALKNVGVEGNLNTKNLVQRIAINTALQFEERMGRNAKELSDSEESGGHDIESNSGKRLIEVKGRADPSSGISLSSRQMRQVATNYDNFYLYIVTNALQAPSLYIIKGPRLLDESVITTFNINYSTWSKLVEDTFNPL